MSRQETAVPVIIPTQVVEEKEIEMDVEQVEDEAEPDMFEEKDEQDMVGVQQTGANENIKIPESEAVESKSPRVWPDVNTERAMRHYKEVTDIQRTYHDEVDIFDTTMVSEYSDEIFKYMTELEVGSPWLTESIFVDLLTGGRDAQPRLYGRAERDFVDNATNPCRLAPSSAPAVAYASRDALDRHQHRRSFPY